MDEGRHLVDAVSFLRVVFVWTRQVFSCSLVAWALVCPALPAVGQVDVEVGFAGSWKLGHDSMVRVHLSDDVHARADRIAVGTLDGDGVPVEYSLAPGDDPTIESVVRVGRAVADLTVTIFAGQEVLAETRVEFDDANGPLPSDQPFVVSMGSPMGIQQLTRSGASGGTTSFSTATLGKASDLPIVWQAYSSCDLVVVCTDDTEFLSAISEAQWSALDNWLRRGGGLVLTLGGDGKSFPPQVKSWIPGELKQVVRIGNPDAIGALVATDKPIRTLEATQVDVLRGDVLLSMADTFGRDIPWWTSFSHGHGTVQLLSSSLDSPAFEEWGDRRLLWQQIVEPYIKIDANSAQKQGSVGEASYLGYSDLVGQLRATLDVFPGVSVMSFSQFAAVLVGILVLVGPIDYLISVRWLGRPHVSWYFSGMCLLLASVGLTWAYQSMRPSELRVNTAQIIDIDTSNGRSAGRLWSHIYSGSATTVNARGIAQDTDVDVRVDWQGLPGRGLGGFASQLNADRGMPMYSIEQLANGRSSVRGVGIPAAGTKCFFATWNAPVEISEKSRLVEISGVDQLTGDVVNPLNQDLLEPALFYHNWYYSLNSRIPAGGSFTISYDVIPKDITRRLYRGEIVDDSDVVTPWDPADRGSLDRLLELMMFYRAAAGQSYATLSHRYHATLDQSNLMSSDQAVLIGRVESPFVKLEVAQPDDSDYPVHQDVDRIWCRIIIPVEPAK